MFFITPFQTNTVPSFLSDKKANIFEKVNGGEFLNIFGN